MPIINTMLHDNNTNKEGSSPTHSQPKPKPKPKPKPNKPNPVILSVSLTDASSPTFQHITAFPNQHSFQLLTMCLNEYYICSACGIESIVWQRCDNVPCGQTGISRVLLTRETLNHHGCHNPNCPAYNHAYYDNHMHPASPQPQAAQGPPIDQAVAPIQAEPAADVQVPVANVMPAQNAAGVQTPVANVMPVQNAAGGQAQVPVVAPAQPDPGPQIEVPNSTGARNSFPWHAAEDRVLRILRSPPHPVGYRIIAWIFQRSVNACLMRMAVLVALAQPDAGSHIEVPDSTKARNSSPWHEAEDRVLRILRSPPHLVDNRIIAWILQRSVNACHTRKAKLKKDGTAEKANKANQGNGGRKDDGSGSGASGASGASGIVQ